MSVKKKELRQGNDIAELIFKGLEDAQTRENRGHLGCSIIGLECERRIWYTWRWAKKPDFPGRILRLFRRGHEEEPNVVKDLQAIGMEVHDSNEKTGRQFHISDLGGHLGGSLDGAITKVPNYEHVWMVLEIKTSSLKAFTKLVKDGVKKDKPQHYTQMQLYMRGTGMKYAFYIAISKDNDDIYTEIVNFDEDFAQESYLKAKRILDSSSPPAKISELPSWWKCKMCDHKEHCQGDQAPLPNCRTCVYATPVIDEDRRGLWTCSKKDKRLTQIEQRKGCEEHLFIPDMINFAEGVDSNEDEGWVEYKSEQGVFFKNAGKSGIVLADNQKGEGQPPWSSKDIHALGDRVLTDDPLIESIRRNFGATSIETNE